MNQRTDSVYICSIYKNIITFSLIIYFLILRISESVIFHCLKNIHKTKDFNPSEKPNLDIFIFSINGNYYTYVCMYEHIYSFMCQIDKYFFFYLLWCENIQNIKKKHFSNRHTTHIIKVLIYTQQQIILINH